MEIQEYVDKQKQFYDLIINYLSKEENTEEENLEASLLLKDIFNQENILQEKEELEAFLKIICSITNNHHRYHNFFQKAEEILLHYSVQIKQTFTNQEIFQIFKNNKRILLFLFEQKIIIPDQLIFHFITKKSDSKKIPKEVEEGLNEEEEEEENINDCKKRKKQKSHYYFYFFPEIKAFLDEEESKMIENELFHSKSDQDNFFKKRTIGENDSIICEMIRQDSIKEFVSYTTRNNISIKSQIEPSVFETNPFLINKKPTLIEYAAFFGSFQIFQYLRLNGVELNSSLWLYVIHSNNAEMIHFLEANQVKPPGGNFGKCIKISIKCHHNDIANYIINNLVDYTEIQFNIVANYYGNVYSFAIKYHNYSFFPNNLEYKYFFYYLCEFGYYALVKIFLKYSHIDLMSSIIRASFYLIVF